MGGCCGPKCSKTFVILYNILFWISGCAFVGLGACVLYDKSYSYLYTLLAPEPDKYPREIVDYVAYASMGVGGIILFVGFFGCCGALQESKCMLGTYIFFLILICFVEAALGLGTLYCWWTFPDAATAKVTLRNQWTTKYTSEPHFTAAFNHAQYSMKCCGVESGNDYYKMYDQNMKTFNITGIYPLTCCVLSTDYQDEEPWVKPKLLNNARDCDRQDRQDVGKYRYDKGCMEEILRWLWLYLIIIGASSGGLALLQILGVLFSLCLMRNIGEEP